MMAYNYQQVPFWDFMRTFNNGAGVDHHAGDFPNFGPPGPTGFPSNYKPNLGRGRRGHKRGGHSHESHQERSQSGSPSPENVEDGGREGSAHTHGHYGRCGGWGGRGGWHGHGDLHGAGSTSPENAEDEAREGSAHTHGRHGRRDGFGGRGGRHGHGNLHHGATPMGYPFGGPRAFDMSAIIDSISAHPLAQAFRTFAEQSGQRETPVPRTENESTFVPPIDIFTTETEYVLHIALPGAKKDDVGVNFDADKSELNIAGVIYRQGDEEFLKTLTQGERKVGVFERTVKIPPMGQEKEEVDGDAIIARMEDGVLIVIVPKVEKEWTDVKRVDIN